MKYISIDEYITHQSLDNQVILEGLRQVILQAAPYIEERLSYGVPYYYAHGGLCYLSVQRNLAYIGFVHGYALDDASGILETKGRKQVKSISFASRQDWLQKREQVMRTLQEALLVNEMRLQGNTLLK